MEGNSGHDTNAIGSMPTATMVEDSRALAQKTARDLRVEDALIYRDQVKEVFASRPQVYNDFLEIMRKFKAQAITTPEVIDRVRQLFRGYPMLIMGFNAFLPDEIGFKIELTDEEQRLLDASQDKGMGGADNGSSLGNNTMGLTSSSNTMSRQASTSSVGGSSGLSSGPFPSSVSGGFSTSILNTTLPPTALATAGAPLNPSYVAVPAPNAVLQVTNPPGSASVAVSGGPSPSPTPTNQLGGSAAPSSANPAAQSNNANDPNRPPLGAQSGQMQQAHAIHYVTKIRNRFSTEPETYRSFLKILHTYQKEQKGIKEVLEQVSALFADHIDLLLEFTYFLPDAVQDQAKERLERAAKEAETRRMAMAPASAGGLLMAGAGAGGALAGKVIGGAGGKKISKKEAAAAAAAAAAAGGNVTSFHHFADGTAAGNKRARELTQQQQLVQQQQQYLNMMGGNLGMMNMSGMNMMSHQHHLAGLDGPGPLNKKANLGMSIPFSQQQQLLLAQQAALAQQQQQHNQQSLQSQQLAAGGAMGIGGAAGGARKQGRGRGTKDKEKDAGMMMGGGVNMVGGMHAGGNGGQHPQMMMMTAQAQMNQLQRNHPSVSTERRFFDSLKEVLLNVSRDSWTEFVKLLELFANNALTKDALFDLVQDVLAPASNGSELFHEFRRLLENRSDYVDRKEDLWFSVPLSEIDFTQCLRCTPSYRQLPEHYPKPKCSDRLVEEEKVLNDNWVSIPIGSEESYSFKHMRKNQYEEALFKCEDERFEIDMIIDSNMSTIRVLDPLAEEIAAWKQSVAVSTASTAVSGSARSAAAAAAAAGSTAGNNSGGSGRRSAAGNSATAAAASTSNGANGSAALSASQHLTPRLSLQLEKRQLSTIHLNAIARIYGDHGEEILELLRKNPAGTIPVVLKRLRQKDVEWRKARSELSKHWKEVQEKNHYKSFDHRSFYFRQHDKKYLSTKQLVADIASMTQLHATVLHQQQLQQQADNKPAGESSSTAAVSTGSSAAGTSTGNNAASSSATVTGTVAAMMRHDSQLALAELSAAGIALTVSEEMTQAMAASQLPPLPPTVSPQMVLRYEHDAHIVHRDIFRIVCHAAETTMHPPSDRERLAALWRDLLRVFFNLPSHYLYPPSSINAAAASSVHVPLTSSSTVDAKGNCNNNSLGALWSVGTRVLTTFGGGLVSSYRDSDDMYEVKLSSGGRAYLRSSSIVGSEQLSAAALSAIGVSKAGAKSDIIWHGMVVGDGPNSKDVIAEPCKVFFGTQMCYVFLRLHHTLFVRLRAAKELAQDAQQKQMLHRLGGAQSAGSFGNALTDAGYVAQPSQTGVHDDGHVTMDGPGMNNKDSDVPLYTAFLGQVFALVEGSIDNARFEEFCRSLLGNKAYVLYSLDKIVSQLMKHLQAMANNDTVMKLIGLFMYHHRHRFTSNSSSSPSILDASLYRSHVAQILSNTMEDVFRMQLLCPTEGICAVRSEVAVQQLGILTPSSAQDNLSAVFNNSTVSSSVHAPPTSTSEKRSRRSDPALSASATAASVAMDVVDEAKISDEMRVEDSASSALGAQVPSANTTTSGELVAVGLTGSGHKVRSASTAASSSLVTGTSATLGSTAAAGSGGKSRRLSLTLSNAMADESNNAGPKTPKAAVLSDDEDDDGEDEDVEEAGEAGEEDEDEEDEENGNVEGMDLDGEEEDDEEAETEQNAGSVDDGSHRMDDDEDDDEDPPHRPRVEDRKIVFSPRMRH